MKFRLIIILSAFFISSCEKENTKETTTYEALFEMNKKQADLLIQLPLECVQQEYPNKLGQVLLNDSHLGNPKALHPAFYGCFDWHSSVHGHWSMVKLIKTFPDLSEKEEVLKKLSENITSENVDREIAYFNRVTENSYERTYGWAWLLKLQEELNTWESPDAQGLAENLQPLTDLIVNRYKAYLPKLAYPIRVGEHSNTAFGLSFAYDYAQTVGDVAFQNIIKEKAIEFYTNDQNCPIEWEPSGYDFLSPCFEEIDLMRKVLTKDEFDVWVSAFMPELKERDFIIEPGKVIDRTDGKLVHLDGLNFSRAWVMYGLANQFEEYNHLIQVANEHMEYSYPNLVGDSYEGSHWLGSFAIYAMSQ